MALTAAASPSVFVGVSLRRPLDQRLKCTAQALHYLRHRPWYKLLLDVLKRDVIKYLDILKDCDPRESLYLIVNELADVYGEHRKNETAKKLYKFANNLSGQRIDPATLRRDAMTEYSPKPKDIASA
jgi:hypothetical protein